MLSSGGTISRRVEGWRCFICRTCHHRACRARTSTFTMLTSSVSFAPTHPSVPGHVTGSPHVRTSIRVATRPPAGRPRSLCVTGVLLQLWRASDVEDDWCCGEGKRCLTLAPARWSEIISQICHEKILVAGCHSFVFPNVDVKILKKSKTNEWIYVIWKHALCQNIPNKRHVTLDQRKLLSKGTLLHIHAIWPLTEQPRQALMVNCCAQRHHSGDNENVSLASN